MQYCTHTFLDQWIFWKSWACCCNRQLRREGLLKCFQLLMGQGLVMEKNVLTSMVCQRENSMGFCSEKQHLQPLLDHSPYSLASEPIFKDQRLPHPSSSHHRAPQSRTIHTDCPRIMLMRYEVLANLQSSLMSQK